MSQASMLVSPDQQFFDNNGLPLNGGKIYFYAAGTLTPQAVYSASDGSTPLSNPVILDSSGRAKIWLVGYYKVILTDSSDNQIWTEDNVSSSYYPPAVSAVTFNQWQSMNDVFTYISPTQFSVPTDRTAVYIVGNRIKATVTAGTIYGSITASTAGGGPVKTTVTVLWDLAYALDGGLSAVWVGIISAVASGSPIQVPIGSVLDWYKSLSGIVALPWGWVQCDGQTLVDSQSPLNGIVIPNLNGAGGGADTFSNGKLAPYLRGGATPGVYSADAIKAHNHGVSAVTVNAHTHTLSGTTTAESVDHTHVISLYKQFSNSSGGGNANLWQDAPDGSHTENSSGVSAIHTHAYSGTTSAASVNGLTGSVDNNGAATETIPKTVTVCKIMRVK